MTVNPGSGQNIDGSSNTTVLNQDGAAGLAVYSVVPDPAASATNACGSRATGWPRSSRAARARCSATIPPRHSGTCAGWGVEQFT